MTYEIKIEKTANGYSAHVSELPGCIAAAKTLGETTRLIEEAITFHREGLRLEQGASVSRIYPKTKVADSATK